MYLYFTLHSVNVPIPRPPTHRRARIKYMKLSVRLLVAGTGTWTTELLGLASSGISDQQGPVVVDQNVLEFLLGGLIDVCKREWGKSR